MEQTFEAEESRTVDATNVTHLSVTNTNGNVRVEGCEGVTLTLHAVKKVKSHAVEEAREALNAIQIVVSEEGPALRVETDVSALRQKRDYSVSYQIRAPKNLTLTVENVNGNVTASDTGDGTTVRSQNGNASAARVEGRASGRTTNGNVRLEDVNGPADGQTTNGNVELTKVAGPSSGASVNGSVRATLTTWKPGCEAHLRTLNGNVTLDLPEDASSKVTASVLNGRIQCDLPVQASAQTRTKLEGALGSGEGVIDLRTMNGNVRVQRMA